jgi:small subunit ribosomal protein S16
MPTKIRLQRKGKKGQPFYHIVIADGRAPRDGKFIERIGTYNPLTRPAEIELNIDKAVDWLVKGAQPTDTVRAILSYKGVMYKSHLLKGVKKGALTPELAQAKFEAWQTEKQAKIISKMRETELTKKEAKKKALAHETEINEAKANAIAKKLAKEREAELEAARAAAEPVAPTPAEVPAEPVAETPAEPVAEAAPPQEEPTTPEEPKQE